LCRTTAPFGVVRLLGTADAQFRAASVSDEIRPTLVARFNQTHYCGTLLDEFEKLEMASSQDAPPGELGDRPLIVLTAGEKKAANRDAFPPNFPLEILVQVDALWLEMQSELASLSTNGQHRIVEGAGHEIHIDQPSAVVQAVEDLLAIVSE
jgi:pimeloyl-ACP methyl ester carboxylesterase